MVSHLLLGRGLGLCWDFREMTALGGCSCATTLGGHPGCVCVCVCSRRG